MLSITSGLLTHYMLSTLNQKYKIRNTLKSETFWVSTRCCYEKKILLLTKYNRLKSKPKNITENFLQAMYIRYTWNKMNFVFRCGIYSHDISLWISKYSQDWKKKNLEKVLVWSNSDKGYSIFSHAISKFSAWLFQNLCCIWIWLL
jgi:hypothetical protein